MKNKTIYPLIVLLCAGCTPHLEYGRRSLNEPVFSGRSDPVFYVSSFQSSAKRDGPGNGVDKISAQTVQFNLLNPDPKNVKAIRDALQSDAPAAPFVNDRTMLDRTIVTTVSKGHYRPADRFVNLRMRIIPLNFSFKNYKFSATEDSTVDIEKLELRKANSGAIKLTGGGAGTSEIGSSTERSLTESGEVKAWREKLTINLDNGILDIYREGERGIDLSGNTLIDMSIAPLDSRNTIPIQIDNVIISMKLEHKGVSLPPEKASLETSILRHVTPNALKADVTFYYVIRRALSKTNEYAEHNQNLEYEQGNCTKKNVTIVAAEQMGTTLWLISNQGQALEIETGASFHPLHFLTMNDAYLFREWLVQNKAMNIGNRKLRLPKELSQELTNPAVFNSMDIIMATYDAAGQGAESVQQNHACEKTYYRDMASAN